MSSGGPGETDPLEDLSSFEVLALSNPGPSEDSTRPEAAENKPKLKRRLLTAWNSVKYAGWSLKSKPRLSKTAPLWLLGNTYRLSIDGERERFRRVFSSLLWLTYRKGFVPLGGSSMTTDCGWGCMLRTAQMLLAQGLRLHLLPGGWTWTSVHQQTKDDLDITSLQQPAHTLPSGASREVGGAQRRRSEGALLDGGGASNECAHRRLVACFGDTPTAPFGLHRLVELSRESGRRPGDWYGPSVAAHLLRKAVEASEVRDVAVYVAQDCTVYVGDVERLCDGPQPLSSTRGRSIIILVPVRLGGHVLNLDYVECVKKLLQLHYCIGIMGGKPKHSLYFVGFQDDYLLYLDPHVCQSVVDVSRDDFPLESFHCRTVNKMLFQRMDPSCTLGFYARGRTDLDTLRLQVTAALTSSTEMYPMFTFVEGSGQEDLGEAELTPDPALHVPPKDKRRRRSERSSMDEFVLL
ncbi:autophagy related 4D, cysteine peptidase b isoform X2 [Brachyhypopomus gauderio]